MLLAFSWLHAWKLLHFNYDISSFVFEGAFTLARYEGLGHVFKCTKCSRLCLLPCFCSSPGVEPEPGTERWEESYPAGADATGGGGAQPFGWPGPRGHTRQCLYANLPLQAPLLLLLVDRDRPEREWRRAEIFSPITSSATAPSCPPVRKRAGKKMKGRWEYHTGNCSYFHSAGGGARSWMMEKKTAWWENEGFVKIMGLRSFVFLWRAERVESR